MDTPWYLSPWVVLVFKVVILLAFVLFNGLFLVWAERKVSAFIQQRLGPMRVGRPHGWLQLIADALKLLAKEDVIPAAVDRWLFVLAPIVIFAPAFMVYVVIPFGPTWVARDLNIGLVYIAAITSFTVVALFMSGWGSNNKYSLLGAMRSAAQLISYEVPLVLSVIGVVMLAGSLSLNEIVKAQSPVPFILLQPLGFIVFLVAGVAELNRTPFDLPEAESELVAGYCTEYSGMRYVFFFLAEYANVLTLSALITTLFLGGWRGPLLPPVVWFLVKTYVMVFVILWIRWTLPRIRVDQLMEFAWKFLVPVALLNIAITGIILMV